MSEKFERSCLALGLFKVILFSTINRPSFRDFFPHDLSKSKLPNFHWTILLRFVSYPDWIITNRKDGPVLKWLPRWMGLRKSLRTVATAAWTMVVSPPSWRSRDWFRWFFLHLCSSSSHNMTSYHRHPVTNISPPRASRRDSYHMTSYRQHLPVSGVILSELHSGRSNTQSGLRRAELTSPLTSHHTPLIALVHTTSHRHTHHTPLISHHSSHTTHLTQLLTQHLTYTLISHHSSQTTHLSPLVAHHSSHTIHLIHLTSFISYQHLTRYWSHTTPLTPHISHLSSHTTHLTLRISHHSSHTTPLKPFISHHSSHSTLLTPHISHHSSHTTHLTTYLTRNSF